MTDKKYLEQLRKALERARHYFEMKYFYGNEHKNFIRYEKKIEKYLSFMEKFEKKNPNNPPNVNYQGLKND